MRPFASIFLFFVFLIPVECACSQDPGQEGREALFAGRFTDSRNALKPEIESGSDRNLIPLYLDTYLFPGQYQEGLGELDRLLVIAPDDPYLIWARGRLLQESGRLQEAEQIFRKGISTESFRSFNQASLATLLEQNGRKEEAAELYQSVLGFYRQGRLKTADELAQAGKSAAALGAFHDANEIYRLAHEVDPQNVRVLFEWAELFRTKYNEADARRTFEEALQLTEHYPDLFVGLARSGAGFDTQERLAQRALSVNPRHVEALNLQAELRILDGQYAEALEILERARSQNPTLLRTLANLASVHFLQGNQQEFTAIETLARTINPRGSSFYAVLAENCSNRFRYPSSLEFAQRSIQADPENPQAYALLGTALMRMGRIEEARQYLQASYDADPFNLFAGNSLTLIEEYSGFEPLESTHFRLYLSPEDSPVLGAEILRVAEACFDSLSRRYPYSPSGKIQLEAYDEADDFAVRVAGVPHVGLLGVSFGDVVAFNTPRAQQGNEYNWARTLWHEIAHTMAIGTSGFHVPRWLTEGLSVYEEQRARPEWGREMELDLMAAFDQGQLLPLAQIDRGFTRPTFPGQILLSYFHASRIIDYLVRHYGFDAIVTTLETLKTGSDIAASLQKATGQTLDQLDVGFRAELSDRRRALAPILAGMERTQQVDTTAGVPSRLASGSSYFQALASANEHLNRKDYAAAENGFKRALVTYPGYIGEGDPYRGLAEVYRATDRSEELERTLEQYLQLAEHAAPEARELAVLFETNGNLDRAGYFLKRSLEVEPYETETREKLADLYDRQRRYSEAVEQHRAVIGLNPVDKARAYYRLANSLYHDQKRTEAKRAVLQSLELAPGYRDAQRLLLLCVDPEQ